MVKLHVMSSIEITLFLLVDISLQHGTLVR